MPCFFFLWSYRFFLYAYSYFNTWLDSKKKRDKQYDSKIRAAG
ncbi:hypothetical protein PROPEN_01721 [Proteus penneri ATCC 35198]|nr:hypothetical protein PROPEN_01721 [Proteus penneri ATCC 35198]